jgi:hypothetical protein
LELEEEDSMCKGPGVRGSLFEGLYR